MSRHEQFGSDVNRFQNEDIDTQQFPSADESFRDLVYRPGARMAGMSGCMMRSDTSRDPLDSLDQLAQQLSASGRLTPNMVQALQLLGNEINDQGGSPVGTADVNAQYAKNVYAAPSPAAEQLSQGKGSPQDIPSNQIDGSFASGAATADGATNNAGQSTTSLDGGLSPQNIYSWVGQMFYSRGQFDTEMAQRMVSNGEISAQTAQLIATPQFADFVSGLLQGRQPTAEQVAQYLPEDLRQNILRDTSA